MSLNYIGSKKSLVGFLSTVFENVLDMNSFQENEYFGDGFSGTGIVGQSIRSKYNIPIQAVDIELYSFMVNYSKLNISYTKNLEKLVKQIVDISTFRDGLITKYYSPIGNRKYFTIENARIIDTLRIKIEELKPSITSDEYIFLLASLVCSADKVANISCVYGAYLKDFKKTAIKPLQFLPVHTITLDFAKNLVQKHNILDTDWSMCKAVYFDPPYNNRQYGSNYFILNYIIEYTDKVNEMRGITGITNYFKSSFCQSGVLNEFKKLLDNTTLPRFIFISYNNEGLVSFEDFKNLLANYGNVVLYKTGYKKFKAQQSVVKKNVMEYLWVIDKSKASNFIEHQI